MRKKTEYTAEEKEKVKAFMDRMDRVVEDGENISSPMNLPEWGELPLDLQVELTPGILAVRRFWDEMERLHNNREFFPITGCTKCVIDIGREEEG